MTQSEVPDVGSEGAVGRPRNALKKCSACAQQSGGAGVPSGCTGISERHVDSCSASEKTDTRRHVPEGQTLSPVVFLWKIEGTRICRIWHVSLDFLKHADGCIIDEGEQ